MPSVEKISIALPPEMAAQVRHAVETGEYASFSEVFRDALREWSRKRAQKQITLEDLRVIWQEAVQNSEPGLSVDEVFDRLERKYRLQTGK
jgi:antitoxin ParD1/3/4